MALSHEASGYLIATAVILFIGGAWYRTVVRSGAASHWGKGAGVLTLAFLAFSLFAVLTGVASLWYASEASKVRTTWATVSAVVAEHRVVHKTLGISPAVYVWDSRLKRFSNDWYRLEIVWRLPKADGGTREVKADKCCARSVEHVGEWQRTYAPGTEHQLHADPRSTDLRLAPEGAGDANAYQAFVMALGALLCFGIANVIAARDR